MPFPPNDNRKTNKVFFLFKVLQGVGADGKAVPVAEAMRFSGPKVRPQPGGREALRSVWRPLTRCVVASLR